MNFKDPTGAPGLARQLLQLSGSRTTAGIGPRPQKRLLQVLHLIREHAAAVAYRSISFGNRVFFDQRIQDLLSLKDECERLLPSLRPQWAEIAGRICRLIEEAAEGHSRTGFIRLERLCERSRYRRFWGPNLTCVPAFRYPLIGKKYRKILIITGPGIGLGDEICCIPLVRALNRLLPDATYECYGFYPGLWKQVLPQALEQSLNGNPMLCFDAVQQACAKGCGNRTLAVFINFGGLSFHQVFRTDKNRPDLVEIAVGAGVLWFSPRSEDPIRICRTMDPVYPGNYQALRRLTECLTGQRPPAPADKPIHLPGLTTDTYQVLVSPFTSKPMLLTPVDWAMLLDGIRKIPGRKPVVCRVLPGTSSDSMEYAERIVGLAQREESGTFAVERLKNTMDPTTPVPFSDLWKGFADSHLVLGIDTYSAHLAAVLEIPAVTLCYDRNVAFWPDDFYSLWIELRHAPSTMLELIRLQFCLSGGLQPRAFRTLQERLQVPLWQRLENDWRRAQELADGSGLEQAKDILDSAWNLLPPAQHRLIELLDYNYAWPKLRAWIETDHQSREKIDWAFQLLNKLHLRRILGLLAHTNFRSGAA